jgi:hypothetical protein
MPNLQRREESREPIPMEAHGWASPAILCPIPRRHHHLRSLTVYRIRLPFVYPPHYRPFSSFSVTSQQINSPN